MEVLFSVKVSWFVADAVPPAARLEKEGVVDGAREGVPLGGREGVPVALACTVRLAEAGREPETGGVRVTEVDAEEEEEEEPEEVSELELLEVPVSVEAAEGVGVEMAVPDCVEAALADCVAVPDIVVVGAREAELLGVPV